MAKKKSAVSARKQALEQQQQKQKQKKLLMGGLATIVILAIAVFAFVKGNTPTPEVDVSQLPVAAEIGSLAPDFELPAHEGGTVRLSDFRGQPVAVIFMHTWWPACNASAPELRAAYDKYQEDGFVVLSVSEQEGHAEVADFVAKYGLSYPFVLDTTGEIGRNYNLYTTPTTYFITPDGVVQDIVPGVVSEFWIDNQMAQLES